MFHLPLLLLPLFLLQGACRVVLRSAPSSFVKPARLLAPEGRLSKASPRRGTSDGLVDLPPSCCSATVWRTSKAFLPTMKEVPAEARLASHQLMLRAGLVRPLASGLYTWLPLGLRVLSKVSAVVREELDAAGCMETQMPSVLPGKLWEESGRWGKMGRELLKFKDRHENDFCLGPTHEEAVVEVFRRDVGSYRQLPLCLYQIGTKFRDEIRPRFGVMRSREFVMKDAYSFHLSDECLEEMYTDIWNAYHRIFSRLGLNFRAVEADSGAIGGAVSHEFQVLAEAGEDAIAVADMEGGASENEKGNPEYAANIERAEALPAAWPPGSSSFVHTAEGGKEPLQELVSTPGAKTIPSLCEALGVAPWECLKTLAVAAEPIIEEEKSKKGKKGKEKSSLVEEKVTPPAVLLVLRGDHSLNEVKAEKLPGVASPLRLLSEEELESAGLCPGFLGPVALSHAAKARGVRVVVDRSAAAISGPFVSGGNSPEMHLRGCQWDDKGDGYTEGVDARVRVRGEEGEGFEVTDLREVVEGDKSPDGVGTLRLRRGIEVGHIFQLGKKYTEAMGVSVQDEKGRPACPLMGCYGIGIGRVVAAAIEQEGGHDEKGIRWPLALAPFHVSVVPVNLHKSELVKEATEKLCEGLVAEGLDVLLDDRKERPGTMFADSDLWGIPVRVVVGEKNLKAGLLECKLRSGDTEPQLVAIETMPQRVAELLRGLESKPKIRQRPNKKNV